MLKKLKTISNELSKAEQKLIQGGHFSGLFCEAKCRAKFALCASGCSGVSPTVENCEKRCRQELNCCLDTCAPPGGHVR